MDDPNRICLTPDAYTVGWVCVLASEQYAARALLDELHAPPPTPRDENAYIVGRMGKHNVVITRPIGQGKVNAADAAVNMTRTFPQIRFGLLVGVGGGATDSPDPYVGKRDIRLGDVVVSKPQGEHGYKIISHLDKPKSALIVAANVLQSHHQFKEGHMKKYIQDATLKLRDLGMPYFGFPGREHDLLFRREYRHPEEGEDCSNCDRTQIVDRDPRPDDGPSIHYGLIASADLTMQDPKFRDALRKSEKVLCFEKEAAGLMDRFPCIAIRGISDYADTHKCKKWQPYAAVAAAAYAKDLLAVIQPHDIARDRAAAQVLEQLREKFNKMSTAMDTKYRHEIMGWLSTLDFKTEQEDLLSRSVFIGKWLLKSEEFMHWVKGSRWQLRCYGEAGTGKTNFCAMVIHRLQKTFGLKRPVIYLYLSDDEHKRVKQTLDNLLGSMLKQLISCGPNVDIPQKLIDAYEGLGNGAYSTREIMKQAFQDLVAKQECVYLIVDGLNQCFPEVSELIKEYALGLVQDGLPLSLLTTSLGYREVKKIVFCNHCRKQNIGMYVHCDCDDGQFDLCLDCKKQGIICPKNHDGEEPYDTVRIEVRARNDELEEYCREMISRALKTGRDRRDERVHPSPKYNPRPIARYLRDKPGLVNRISRQIAGKAQCSLIIAQLWLQNLFESKEPENDKGVLRFLDKIPEKRLTAYVDERIAKLKRYRKENELHIAFTTLALIMSACRYLTILQLQHALALHSDQVIESTLNDRTFILWSANGLITIDKAEESCSFVRFFHGDHVRKANDQEIDKEAVRLLKHPVHLARLGALDIVETLLKCERLNLESEKELIHTASAMGYPEIIRLLHSALSQTNKIHIYNIDTRDERGLTPLHYASLSNSARAGEVTEVLLELGADPNLADDRGCTPYMMASLLQHTQVMEVLQSNVTSPNSETRDTQDLPALTLAEHDHWALLREVTTTGRADLTYKCMLSGDTLLHMATAANETDILRLLIENKLRPESAVNEQGHTPLHLARTVEIAKLLVDDGYHVDSTDLNNNTPLDIARRQPKTRDVADYLEDVSRMSEKKHRTERWEENTKGESETVSSELTVAIHDHNLTSSNSPAWIGRLKRFTQHDMPWPTKVCQLQQ
ncbi:unnamed protein product [Aspergillus oryzae]|uniref:Unnamed protein product n=1 Tax=Aspergillus oryzae TaxID=5062 RepID=A0AAN5C0C1_ASPOZ|nr:unnamed protein product [Aspergillus oryzae]